MLKSTLAVAAGVAVLSNEKAREAIKSVIGRAKSEGATPEVWRPDTRPTPNGGSAPTTAAGIAEETS